MLDRTSQFCIVLYFLFCLSMGIFVGYKHYHSDKYYPTEEIVVIEGNKFIKTYYQNSYGRFYNLTPCK